MNVSETDLYFKWTDQRQTSDSTKEMGTADFSNILNGLKEDISKSFQIEQGRNNKAFAFGDMSLQTDRQGDYGECMNTLREMDEESNGVVNSSFWGDFSKARKQKKHRREISVTDVMPETNLHMVKETPELHFSIAVDNKFMQFWKKFRITMRCLVFVQYFTVTELIKLKLVHSQLNQIINQDIIDMAIQIGNLSEKERELYWKSKIYENQCPSSISELIKHNHEPSLQLIKITLETNVPGIIDFNDEILTKIISNLFINKKLLRIYGTGKEMYVANSNL